MTTVNRTPVNKNILSHLNFSLSLKRAPHVDFFIQKINTPWLRLDSPNSPNPFSVIPTPGDHLAFGPLDITFKIDEDLNNYMELYNWIRGLGKPANFDEFKALADQPQHLGSGILSDMSVTIMSNIKNPNKSLIFIDAFPIYLSGMRLDTTDPAVSYLVADATFKYQRFDVSIHV
jgi:hypothetical protein